MSAPDTPPPARTHGLTLTVEAACDFVGVRAAAEAMKDWLRPWVPGDDDLQGLVLATVEAGNNAVKYAGPEARQFPVRFEFSVDADWIEVRVTDRTPGFDWPAEVQLPGPDSEGGRGLFLMTTLTDEVRYYRSAGQNLLRMRKRRPAGAPAPGAAEAELKSKLGEAEEALDAMTAELASTYESLTALFRYSAELGRGAEVGEFAGRLLSDLLQITQADAALLRLVSADGHCLDPFLGWPGGSAPAATEPVPDTPPPLRIADPNATGVEIECARTRRDVWFGAGQPLGGADPLRLHSGLRSGLCHPFVAGNQLVGTAVLGRRTLERGFTAAQVNLLHTFTDFLGIHIASARLQDERTRIRLLERELQIAADIQRSLLPAVLPSCPPFRLTASCVSARIVGGDFYDMMPVGQPGPGIPAAAPDAARAPGAEGANGVLIVIADVMGKGVPAALFAAILRNAIRSMPHLFARPGRLLETVNQTLFDDFSRAEMFATVKLVFADPGRCALVSASAGHGPLLLATRDRPPRAADESGLPLGIDPRAGYGETIIPLAPGDYALLYTDGVTEARDPAGGMFGDQRLLDWFGQPARAGQPIESLQATLLQCLSEFCGSAPAADDQTFVLIHHAL